MSISGDDLPSMSYSSTTGSSYSLGNTGALTANLNYLTGTTTGTNTLHNQILQQFQPTTAVITGSPGQTISTKEKIVARLIRYVVVDPDPKLADVKPEMCIIMQGTAMLNGADDRGFLMELAPKIAEKLDVHNSTLTNGHFPMWEDKDGKTHAFKARRLSNFDVVIESLREYK